jgi:hypothetical protein
MTGRRVVCGGRFIAIVQRGFLALQQKGHQMSSLKAVKALLGKNPTIPYCSHLGLPSLGLKGGIEMEFRLIYQGPLPGASEGQSKVKHAIRRQLHPQLREVWNTHPAFAETAPEQVANHYRSFGFGWIPLICKHRGIACDLDILFLRRDTPGGIVKKGGDIDNRLKIFLDALRKPDSKDEIGDATPAGDEEPFFVLLEDDYYVTKLKLVTDRLLTPVKEGERINDVHLVVNVKVVITDIGIAYYEFLS